MLMPEVVKGDSATTTRLIDSYRQKASGGSLYARFILAELLDATNQTGEVERILQTAANQPNSGIANLMLGGFEIKHGNAAAAAKAFEADLYQDPDGSIARTVSFAIGMPREQLINLYSARRREAALQLANQSSDYHRAPEKGDDEGGLIYAASSDNSILNSQSVAGLWRIYLYPLYAMPANNLFKIPPGHGPLETDSAATQIDDSANGKFHTVAELNLESAIQGRRTTLRLLSQIAARGGDFQAAVDFERAR